MEHEEYAPRSGSSEDFDQIAGAREEDHTVPVNASASSSSAYLSTNLSNPGLERSGSSHSDQLSLQQQAQRPGLAEQRRFSSGISGNGAMSGGDGGGYSGSIHDGKDEAVPVGFDEGVLRALCDMDGSLSLLADRIKQSIASCKQVAVFFRSRAEIEEKYARSLQELYRTTGDVYSRADCKAGTFVSAYHSGLRLQSQVAENKLRFAQRLNEMSDELLGLAREGERLRKMHKENGMRYQGILQESEMVMDKAKSRFDSTAEELERVLVAKEGESMKDSGMRSSPSSSSTNTSGSGNPSGSGGGKRGLGKAMKGGLLFKGKGAGAMAKQEDDVRSRMAQASETFRKAVLESQALRQEYFNFQQPKILRLLKECADELDMGTQYHLTRFAFMFESSMVAEASIMSPMNEEGSGLKGLYENIDNRTDFKQYMQNYAVARGSSRGPRRDGPYEEGFLPRMPPHAERGSTDGGVPVSSQASQITSNGGNPSTEGYPASGLPAASGATFGVDLGEQLARDGTEVPKVVEKCAAAIEAYGLDSVGIYRLSGTTSRVQALKAALDKDVGSVDIMSDLWSADINVVSGALKLWFRELPEPLLTYALYHQFIDAARYENDRLRHIRLHEQVNELPDPNYATLKFFMGHLDKIRKQGTVNQMSASNLSIVFGPTLLGAPPHEGGLNLEHMSFQCKAIETILEKYAEIFVEEDDGVPASS
ncbi:hypothetical protein BD324DRAFT_619059 [Kockovaella imperatae]|uniref:GTPase activating protein n=1 Tax=Kockovaella imperatae TaxID=4999 RepID=A0A1Y1UMI1_9TREE|nr:hypothetical protein BD324DRAFT_619059 [Kockovaella imperatae]ORX39261.1 hypothetical protein BD324DRAFT_619059 [Kockovaella imperatae]